MALHADAGCIMKVNVHCEACKMKAMEVLSSVVGVYSVTIDANKGIASIYGEVDPNMFMRAIATSGRHGQLVHANVKHPQINHNRVALGNPFGYSYRRTFPHYSFGNYHSYLPLNGQQKYHKYGNGCVHCCSLM